MGELPTTQVLTCKLKLLLDKEQVDAVRCMAWAYRNALNHASAVVFANGKISQGMKLQTMVYKDLRERFDLPSQMACNTPRQVAAYKTLWERARSNAAHKTKGWTKRRYKGLDKAPKFTALTVTLNPRRDWALGKEQTVKGVDLSRRNIAVESKTRGKCRFYHGGHQKHLAERAASARSALQAKGARGAKAVLRKLALRVSMRTLLIWQDWLRTGRLSTAPEAPGDEAKAARLSRYAELRWSLEASSVL